MNTIDKSRLRDTLWQAIREYADALATAETMHAVHEVFADAEALDLKKRWDTVTEEKKAILNAIIESLLLWESRSCALPECIAKHLNT